MELIKIEEKNIIFKYNEKNKEFNGILNVKNISNKIVLTKEIKFLLISIIIEKEINDYKEAIKEFKNQDYKNIGQKNKIIGIFSKINDNNLNIKEKTEINKEKEILKTSYNSKINEEKKNVTKTNNSNYYLIFISIIIFFICIIIGKKLFSK